MRKLYFLLLFVIAFFSCHQSSFAAVTLSINAVDGSNSLRFMAAEGYTDKKELRIRVNSTGGKQYQVFQRVNEPLVNEKGESLDLRALQTATIGNSNGSGTLYLQNIEQLSMGEQLIFTSGQGGDGDSFVVAYGINPAVLNGSGNFSGRLVFTVREVGEPSQDQSLVNIFVESRSSNMKLSVSGGKNKSLVRVKDADIDPLNADFVKIVFEGNVGGDLRITQEVDALPQSVTGGEISPGVLRFSVEGGSADGVKLVNAASLTRASTLLYSGRGDANEIRVVFYVDPALVMAQDSGLFTGSLKYVVETEKGRQEFLVNLEFDVQPVFTVDVNLPPEGVSFQNVLPNAPAIDKEVEVVVRSNLHRPYQVLQDLQSPLSNGKGDEIRKDYFTMMVQVPAEARGHTKYADFAPIQTGEYPVYSSDSQGSSVKFKVVYRLQGYPQMSGGNFAAPIRFSLNQN